MVRTWSKALASILSVNCITFLLCKWAIAKNLESLTKTFLVVKCDQHAFDDSKYLKQTNQRTHSSVHSL